LKDGIWYNNAHYGHANTETVVDHTVGRGCTIVMYPKISGWNIQGQKVTRRIEPKDIAITLSNILQTKPPSGADGEVLIEVLEEVK